MIWDLSLDDDNVIVDSSRQKELHQEPVTKVSFTSKISAIFRFLVAQYTSQPTSSSFGRDVKLGVPCFTTAFMEGLN